MVEIERRHDLLGQPRVRIVGDPHVEFFQHDVALGQHVLVLEDEAGHAVGLEFHHLRQLLARHALEIAGVIGRGEGVLVAADPQHGLGEFAGRMLAGALEHQMFEEMREPGFARRLVGRADLVPDHLRDDRGAVIGDHHHLQAVAEREAGGTFRSDRGLGKNALAGRTTVEARNGEERNGKAVSGHHDLSKIPDKIVRGDPRHHRPRRSRALSRRREMSLTIRHTCPGTDCIPCSAIPSARCRTRNSATASGSRAAAGSGNPASARP